MIKFLAKGLFRDRSRSLFPILTTMWGAVLIIFLYSWIEGAMGSMFDITAKLSNGHIRVTTQAYVELADQMPNDLALLDVTSIKEKLDKIDPGYHWVPRIRFGGLLDIPNANGETQNQGPVYGIGLDLKSPDSPEIELLNLNNILVTGRLPQEKNEILIAQKYAQKIGLTVGDTATLIGSAMDGSMTFYNFKVSGIINFSIMALDRGAILADINDVRLALNMPDGASEILGVSKTGFNNAQTIALANAFNQQYLNKEDEFSPIMQALGQQKEFEGIIVFASIAFAIMLFVFLSAMSLVLWNSFLMGGLRRYGEIGVRLAIGESKGAIYRSMIMESILIGIVGSIVGTIVGLLLALYLQEVGFDLTEMMQGSSVMFPNIIRAKITPKCFYMGFIPGVLAPVLGTMIAGIGIYKRQTASLFKELEV